MKNGKISTMGTYDELSNNELANMFPDPTEEEKDKPQEGDPKKLLETLSEINLMSEEKGPEKSEEEVETGAISFSIYRKYYRYGASVFALVFLVFLLIFAQLFSNGADLFITYWTNKLEAHHNATQSNNKSVLNKTLSGIKPNETVFISLPTNTSTGLLHLENSTLFNNTFEQYFNYTILEDTSFPSTQEDYIIIYSLFIIASMILTPLRSLLFFKIMMNASKGLHNNMFINILKAPIKFFDTNPSGRILNRFSYDMGVVDELLPKVTLEAIQVFLVMSGILMMVFIVSPMMILPAVFLAMLFFYLRHVYVKSAQDIKRLEGVNKAPVFSHITASLYGLPTIRASNAESMIIKEFDCLQDQHTGTWYMYIASSEVFGFYLDVICTVFLALVTFQFLIFREGNILSGNVGLVISQSLILTGMLQLGVRRSAEVASYMISVERVLQYTKLESEGDDDLPIKSISQEMAFKGKLRFINPEKNWPQVGRIEFRNTFLRYDPNSPAVLKNLNIEIAGGEKVGVVGRTGAGKSSLISSLFRLTPIEGTILIDDVDTSKIPLEELRSHISIIPQEPVLFSSSVRYNLDPFNKVDDDVLWRALENVELKSAIESLDQQVSEGGSNFSAGQRQLMCLARAIVRNNKILVMDEATANVDHHTDSLIQKTIRENFKDCTVLTIAHRLNTIMDSDKVLVMDAGEAVEFAHPYKLLQDPNGYFTKMVKQTGSTMEVVLRKVAKEDYEKKFCEKTS